MNTSRLRQTLLSFGTGQGASQAIQIVSGFVLVRYMDIHEYGIAAFMIAVQGSAGILSDLGLRDGIVAVNGQNAFDKYRIGRLVGAAMRQRHLHLLPVSAGIVLAFVAFHFLQGLPLSTVVALSAISVAYAVLNGWNTYYAMPFILRHDMKAYYKPQLVFQFLRLMLLLLCLAFNFLDVMTLALANVFAIAGSGLWYRYASAELLEIPARPSPDDTQRLRSYIWPLMPLNIFSAFQDQVTVFILAVAGQSTNLAHAFALGRLGIVFQFFSTATIMLAAPWLARAPSERLAERYIIVAGSALALAGAVVLGSFLLPDAYLWILGHQYQGLYVELWLAIGAASTFFLYSVLFYINRSRMWFWPWSGFAYVAAVISTQAACIFLLDMSQTRNALLMSLLVSAGMLALQVLQSVLGFAFKNNRGLEIKDEAARS